VEKWKSKGMRILGINDRERWEYKIIYSFMATALIYISPDIWDIHLEISKREIKRGETEIVRYSYKPPPYTYTYEMLRG